MYGTTEPKSRVILLKLPVEHWIAQDKGEPKPEEAAWREAAWFGPRDCSYRTGDLGRQMETSSAVVEQTTRLRSEASVSSWVRSTPTFRRPIINGLAAYGPLIRDIKKHLKKRLATYAIPTIIVPVKLPSTSNGDKPLLPFPDTAQLEAVAKLTASKGASADESAFTELETVIRDLWFDVLPNKPPSIAKMTLSSTWSYN
ncbi:hypothetical protein JCM33374_g1365 [Metschnikowia sp. JCM 33374]|nr:hypothetical protein JCM33374_g1365 [Metschnikowia sp. JCM 33374]